MPMLSGFAYRELYNAAKVFLDSPGCTRTPGSEVWYRLQRAVDACTESRPHTPVLHFDAKTWPTAEELLAKDATRDAGIEVRGDDRALIAELMDTLRGAVQSPELRGSMFARRCLLLIAKAQRNLIVKAQRTIDERTASLEPSPAVEANNPITPKET